MLAMTFTTRDKIATGLVTAAVVAYVGYLVFDGVPLVHDVRGMAAVALVLGFASRRIGGTDMFAHRPPMRVLSIGCVAVGFSAFFTENAVVLAVFMAMTVGLWLIGMFATIKSHRSHAVESQQRASRVMP